MKKLFTLLCLLLAWPVHAGELEKLALRELPGIAALYADGYARLVKDSLKARLLYKDKQGECTVMATFKMEAFDGAANFTQFVGFFNCPIFHRLLKPNKKLFLSDLYRFYMGEPELDISHATINDNLIKIPGRSRKMKKAVTAVFEPSGGPGWWRLKQVQGMTAHEVLSGM